MATIPTEDWKEWGKLIEQLDLRSLVEEQDTRAVTAKDTMVDAYALFATHDILSAPVYDPESGGFIGMIDTLDIVAFLCRFSGSLGGTKRLEREELNLDALKQKLASMDDEQRSKIWSTPVQAVIGLSERTAWEPVSVTTPPQTLVRLLADPHTHRVPITSEEGDHFLGMVTQLDVIKWIAHHKQKIPQSLRNLHVRDFMAGKNETITIPSYATMIEALLKIDENKVSALPVVDTNGHLKGNISASDIKKLKLQPTDQPEEILQKMFVPVSYFLAQPPVTCTMENNMEDILSLVDTKRVHRIWTVDSNCKPVGVVSLGDVLAQFVPRTVEKFYVT